METAVAQPEGTPLKQQQQETVHDALQTMHGSKTHNLDDTEDYGPLKKKHKYRDDHQRSGSISFSAAHPSAPVGGDIESAANVLDSSARMEHVPFVSPAAAVADAQDGPVAAAAGGDQDHHHLASTDATHAEEQQQTEEAQHQPHHDERSKSRDLASSPGSVNEKARKHNFYVPSREVAFLLDNISSTPASVDFPLQYDPTTTTTTDGIPSATGTGGDNATMNISEAQANANALLAIGTSITGRQAAKIAAMEAKEKSRIAKELELEEAKSKRKAELERKRLENVRKKAEKDASGNGIHNLKRSDSSASNQQADGASPPVSASNATLNSQSKPAANRSKRAAAPRRSNAKTKLDSPELPLPNSATTNASNVAFPPSPDIKIHSPSTSHLAFNPYNNNTASATAPGVMALPPMPEPATEGMMGFIPYASEGARAAALAKAAKQQKMNGGSNAGSPPTSIPVPLPSTKNGKSTSNSGNVGGSSRAGGSSSSSTNNKRGNNNNSKMNKALQNVVSQQSISNSTSSTGRASPTNALEHAAAAIDAVLDAGAAARAQANFEEEEVDDRLYCIVSD
jgi:hypothetical protein